MSSCRATNAKLTHTAKARGAYQRYSRTQWETLCRELARLQVQRRRLVAVRAAAVKQAKVELARLARDEAAVLDRVDRITPSVLDAHLAKLKVRRDAAEDALRAAERTARARRAPQEVADHEAVLERLRALCEDASPEQRRRIADIVVASARIEDAELAVSYHLPGSVVGLGLGQDEDGGGAESVQTRSCSQLPARTLLATRRIPLRKKAA